MILDQFWLTEAQFLTIAPHLPTDTRGKTRVDDRRVISGIVHVIKLGGRWIDALPVGRARAITRLRHRRSGCPSILARNFDRD